MKINKDTLADLEFDEEFKTRAFELLDESQALQFAEGLRLGSALSNLHDREYNRIEKKYGKGHPRTLEMADRMKATENVNKVLFSHYSDASTPYTNPGDGWAVDGFVRTAVGNPVAGVTVAAYDSQDRWHKSLGYACTNEKGYFSIVVEKLPDKPPSLVSIQGSKGKKLLKSNEVKLAPEPKSSDRVEIIIGDTDGADDCMSPVGDKGKPRPPEQPVGGKERPAPADSEKEERKKTLEEERQKLKEKGEQKKEPSKPPLREAHELSAINGIGLRRATKLKKANIKDVKTFIATDNRKLVKILGDLDFKTMKTDARSKLEACYLGNKNTMELHDLNLLKNQCQVDEIKKDNRIFFSTKKEATAVGYDFCVYCFGKDKSKR